MHRRRFLLGAGGLAGIAGIAAIGGYELIEHGKLPGKSVLDRTLGRCDATVPPIHAGTPIGPQIHATFQSERRGQAVGYRIAYPPGHDVTAALPVAILLHGFGGNETTELDGSRYPEYQALAIEAGTPPYALASVAGGNGYWHPHPGDDPLAMIFDEFLPLLGARGLRVDRAAVLGTSMGGFGAILCGLTQPGRFATVVASSPAFWRSYGEARAVNPGAFESEADWRRYGDLLHRVTELDQLPLHVYVGDADPFQPAIAALRHELANPAVVAMSTGCHDSRLWRHYAPEQLRLIGAALGAV